MKKDIIKLFAVIALYALSGGMFYSFEELWMIDNMLSIRTVGIVFSLCSVVSVSLIFLCSNLIRQKYLKKFVLFLLMLKSLLLISLFMLNGSGYSVLIKFIVIIEYAIDSEIFACFYPLLSMIKKDDKIYARRGLINSGFDYFSVLLGGFLVGKEILGIVFNYNTIVFLSFVCVVISFLILFTIPFEKYLSDEDKKEYNLLTKLVQNLNKDKISLNYLLFVLVGNISYYGILGLKTTLFTNDLGFSLQNFSVFSVVVGIIAVFIGTLILEKFTFKNNYINAFIKYGFRAVLFIIAIILSNKSVYFITLFYILLITESYTHVLDAPFINRFDDKLQLAFSNLREMFSYFGIAIGTFFCGILLTYDIKFNFVFALIFCILQVLFLFIAINLKEKEDNCDRK